MSRNQIVIIGGGLAGTALAKELSKSKDDLHITLVEPKEYYEVPFAQLRALTDPGGFALDIRKPLVDLLPGVNIVQERAKGFDDESLTLENGATIPYDWLVLATGSRFDLWPFLKGSELTISDRISSYQKHSNEISDAKNVLIIGGGPVGVELAGEIKSKWPEKELTLVQGANRLLDQLSEKMSRRAEKILTEMGVKIETGKILTRDENNIWQDNLNNKFDADLVIAAVGIDLNTEWISGVEKTDRGALLVSPDLRLKNYDNVFAIGDINDVPEIKLGALAAQQAQLTAKNIQKLIADSSSELKPYKPSPPVSLVTLGWKKGAVQLPFGHPHFLAFMKQKDLFVSRGLN